MAAQRPNFRSTARSMAVFVAVSFLVACSSQPSKYRHSNDCKCPKWNYVPKPPADSEHADGHPDRTPYYCGPGSRS